MAALTSYNSDIAGVESGAIRPREETSPVTAVLNGADTVLKAYDQKLYNDSRDAAADQKTGLNQIAALTFQSDKNTNNSLVPQAAVDTVTSLNNAKKAVDQGNLPPVAYTTQLQNQTQAVMAAHPDAAYSIMEYMKSSGHNAAMFPALEAQQATQKALQQGADQSQAYGVDYARKNGVDPTLPLADQAKYGLALSYARDQQQQAILAATAARESAALSQTQKQNAIKEAGTQGLASVQDEVGIRTNSIFDTVRNQISAIGDNPQRDSIVTTRLIPALDNAAGAAKASAHAHLVGMHIGTDENFKSVDALIDSQVAGVKAVFADKSGGLQKTLENLKSQYGIDTARAAPLLFKYGQAVGNNNVAALLGPTSMMDPALQTQLGAEWKGIATSGAIDAQTHFNNIVSILNGNTSLKNYSEADANKYIGAIVTGQKASEQAILQDRSGGQDHHVYLNTTSNVLNAAHALTPASDVSSLEQATGLIATQASRVSLDKLSSDDNVKDYTQSVGMASHLTSVKLLQNYQSKAGNASEIGLNDYQSIEYNNKAGIYQIKTDPVAAKKAADAASAQAVAFGRAPVDPRVYSSVGTEAQKFLDSMNQTLDHAVKTTKYDPDVPKSATPIQLRNAIATGQVIGKAKEEKSAEELWNTSEANIENKLAAFPQIIQQQDAARAATSAQTGSDTSNMKPEDRPVNNPGNLRASPTSFRQYGSLDEGIKAADGNLQAYKNKHGIDTIEGIVSRWAPAEDNNDTQSYIKQVSDESGYDPKEKLDLTDPHVRAVVLSAMFRREGTTVGVGRVSKAIGGSQVANNSFKEAQLNQKDTKTSGEVGDEFRKLMVDDFDYGGLKDKNPLAYLGFQAGGGTENIQQFKSRMNVSGLTFIDKLNKSDPDYAMTASLLKEAGIDPDSAKGKIILGKEFAEGNTFTLEHELMHRGLMALREQFPQEMAKYNNDHLYISAYKALHGTDGHNDDLSVDREKGVSKYFGPELDKLLDLARKATK